MKVRYIIVAFFILSIDKSSPIINRTLASVTVSYCLLGFCTMFISLVKKYNRIARKKPTNVHV